MQPSRVAIRRLLGQTQADTYGETSPTTDGRHDHALLASNLSRNAIYNAGAGLTCLDRSEDQQHAVIAGGKVFKILRIDGTNISEGIDLRGALSAWASAHNDSSYISANQLDIRAVKWLHASYIVTASGNGSITLYDINRLDGVLEVERVNKHTRQVHQLDVCPHRPSYLLSASQDSIVRHFDVRTNDASRPAQLFKNRASFKCNSGAIRDVKWSSNDGFVFACASDEGLVMKWDIRRPTAPMLKINAHEGACWSLSWHPDGQYLISGGSDQFCKVWDLSPEADRRQRPKWTIRTPAPVSTVAWRPAYWSSTAQGKRAAQVAVAYDDRDAPGSLSSTIHIWDLARPSLPFKEITDREVSRAGLLWHKRDILWTVGKNAEFAQNDISYAPKVIDRRSLSSFDLSARGDIAMLLEERPPQRRPRLTTNSSSENLHRPSSLHGQSPNIGDISLSISYSDSEEDVVGSFLQAKNRYHRRNSTRSTLSMSSTPPTTNIPSEHRTLKLDESLKVTGFYQPQQVMAIGHVPTTSKREMYRYLSESYLLPLSQDTPEAKERGIEPIRMKTSSILEKYAKTAERVGYFRLAQSWKLLAYTLDLLLTRRAHHHRNSRLENQEKRRELIQKQKKQQLKEMQRAYYQKLNGEETPRRIPPSNTSFQLGTHQNVKSILSEEIESSSNVPTPIARPVGHSSLPEGEHAPPPLPESEFQLPPQAHAQGPKPIEIPRPEAKSSQEAHLEGYDFYGLENSSQAIDIGPPPRKPPFKLDYETLGKGASRPPAPLRHDSTESFDMFSTSSDSTVAKFGASSMHSDKQSDRRHSETWREKELRNLNTSFGSEKWIQGSSTLTSSQDSSHMSRSGSDHYNHAARPPLVRIQEASFRSEMKDQDDSIILGDLEDRPDEPLEILESDFQPGSNDPVFLPTPLDPNHLVQRTINYETLTSVIHAAAMVLLIRPLLPTKALDPLQGKSIIKQYHSRLESFELFTEANLLRNLVHPELNFYPTTKYLNDVHFYCTECQQPLEDNTFETANWRCARCRLLVAGCAICQSTSAPIVDESVADSDTTENLRDRVFSTAAANLWMWCQGCGHGGHQACMRLWHAGPDFEEGSRNSDGMCPLQGCLHDCIPGKWREQLIAEEKEELKIETTRLVHDSSHQRGARSVRRDSREVLESRAVAGVRDSLIGGSAAVPVPGSSRTSGLAIAPLSRSPRLQSQQSRERRSMEVAASADSADNISNSV